MASWKLKHNKRVCDDENREVIVSFIGFGCIMFELGKEYGSNGIK